LQRICGVVPRSPAHKAGLRAGDVLLKLNGAEIRDVLDYMYYENDEILTIEYERGGKRLSAKVRKDADEETGLTFETGLMDKKKSCRNKCVFCFVDQLPKNMRETLYFKDDDERLSFLMGNYVTLTNLGTEDLP
jgi:NifB/MoaA-like Fe-S oxidoreductase